MVKGFSIILLLVSLSFINYEELKILNGVIMLEIYILFFRVRCRDFISFLRELIIQVIQTSFKMFLLGIFGCNHNLALSLINMDYFFQIDYFIF